VTGWSTSGPDRSSGSNQSAHARTILSAEHAAGAAINAVDNIVIRFFGSRSGRRQKSSSGVRSRQSMRAAESGRVDPERGAATPVRKAPAPGAIDSHAAFIDNPNRFNPNNRPGESCDAF
jgi:hypothetical protein